MDVKSKKFNILACCAAGNGCCQLVSLKVKRVFTKLGLKCNVEANTVSVGKAIGQKYDVVYCGVALEPQFAAAKQKGAYVIPLKNIMSEAEIEEKTKLEERSAMKEFTYVIRDAEGLHARPAGLLVKLAQGFSCTIQLSANGKSADAKRLFAVMKLAAKCGQELRINVEGPDETAAARALEEFCAKEL